MSNTLHIVCLDAPAPPNYGGAIDMYYKIVALAKLGNKIILHYFNYNNNRNAEGLKQYCAEVHEYKRATGLKGLSLNKPYIVSSRINQQLIANLNKDEHPVLLEGIHGTGIIPCLLPAGRKIIVRLHNDEAAYYHHLYKAETNAFKKVYFHIEKTLLRSYQKKLPQHPVYISISNNDAAVFKSKYGLQKVEVIPGFIPWQQLTSISGKGSYCLYHGNLSVPENSKAAAWLITKVFAKLTIPFVIAGRGATDSLKNLAKAYAHIKLVDEPDDDALEELIKNAHINILPSLNATGVKIKLLHALFSGRYCITNQAGVEGSGFDKGIIIANEAETLRTAIAETFLKPFVDNHIMEREYLLLLYNNDLNAQQLMRYAGIV